MQYRSRLKNKVRNTLFKNTLISVTIIIVIFVFVVFFGIQLLVKLSLFLGNIKSVSEISSPSQSDFVLPPTFNPLPEATNSANIEVSGIGQPGQTIELFLNGEKKTEVLVDNSSQFKIAQLRLETGTNRIKARIKSDGKESDFTDEVNVLSETTPPALEIKEPFDGQVIRKTPQVKIVGQTESEASVYINDFLPIVDSNGSFSYIFPLKEGENVIKVIARDKAGNQTANEIKVTFEP